MKNKISKKTIAVIAFFLIVAIASIGLAGTLASPDFHKKSIAALDEKRNTVLAISVTATATSTALTVLPTDWGNPIANQLVEYNKYFLVVLTAIVLEKYLLTLTGYGAFYIIIPFACVLGIIGYFSRRQNIKTLSLKLFVFAIAIFLVVPVSIKASELIEQTYRTSIEETMQSAQDAAEEANKASEQKNGIADIFENRLSELKEEMNRVVNKFIEAIAVLIVTTCVLPILVLVFFVWLVKMLFGVQLGLSAHMIGVRKGNIKDTIKDKQNVEMPE